MNKNGSCFGVISVLLFMVRKLMLAWFKEAKLSLCRKHIFSAALYIEVFSNRTHEEV